MIVLDTNVISEPFRPAPDPGVLAWIAAQDDIAIAAISIGELFRGVLRMPTGRRRDTLAERIETTVAAYSDKVLPYDEQAARAYAGLAERRRSMGRPIGLEDAMIAATCLTRNASVATRNVDDFAGLGLEIVNPWTA